MSILKGKVVKKNDFFEKKTLKSVRAICLLKAKPDVITDVEMAQADIFPTKPT